MSTLLKLVVAATMVASGFGTLAASPAPASNSIDDQVVIELVRTADDVPASFRLTVQHPPSRTSDSVTLGAAALLRTDEHGEAVDAYGLLASSYTRQSQPTASVGGTQVNACTTTGVCQPVFVALGSATLVTTEDTGADGFNRFYLVMQGFDILELGLDADGWDLRITGDASVTLADGLAAESFGMDGGTVSARHVGSDGPGSVEVVALGTRGVEAFTGATLPGKDSGSLAFTLPPCSSANVPTGLGVGTVTLAGGQEAQQASCQPGSAAVSAAGVSSIATDWTVEGLVAGDTTQQDVRLVVVDLPDCRYLIPGIVGAADDCGR